MNGQDGYSALQSLRRLCGYAGLQALAACFLLSACNGKAASEAGRRTEPERAENPPRVQSDSLSMEKVKPAMVCPSQSFEPFLRAFANNGDLRVAYTAKPVKSKYPYYWKSNTEPGDPRYPKWITEDGHGPATAKYRYDIRREKFVRDERDLKPGQIWVGLGLDGKEAWFPEVEGFQIDRVSDTHYDVKYNGNAIDTYEFRSDCWYYVQHWALEPIVDCEWPDDCRRRREREGEFK